MVAAGRIAAVAVSEIPYDLITMAAPTASDRCLKTAPSLGEIRAHYNGS